MVSLSKSLISRQDRCLTTYWISAVSLEEFRDAPATAINARPPPCSFCLHLLTSIMPLFCLITCYPGQNKKTLPIQLLCLKTSHGITSLRAKVRLPLHTAALTIALACFSRVHPKLLSRTTSNRLCYQLHYHPRLRKTD